MIVKNPSETIVGFDNIEWVVQNEEIPSEKAAREFLEERMEDDDYLGEDVKFKIFSIAKDGSILIEGPDGDDEPCAVLLVGDVAKEFGPSLRKSIEKRMETLQKLLGQ